MVSVDILLQLIYYNEPLYQIKHELVFFSRNSAPPPELEECQGCKEADDDWEKHEDWTQGTEIPFKKSSTLEEELRRPA